MRKVYLTEEQYVGFVLNECSRQGVLNEDILSEANVIATIFKGCQTFSDYARRVLYIASAGIIMNAAIFRNVINNIPVGTATQKQELLAQVENVQGNKGTNNTAIFANAFSISQNGINHIKEYEKCNLTPYFATPLEKRKGIQTIGWGHKITENDPEWLRNAKSITQEQADQLFVNDMHIYEGELTRALRGISNNKLKNAEIYPQGFIDAAISMIYNSGLGNFKASDFYQTWCKCRIDPKTGKIRIDDYNYTISKIPRSCVTQNGKVVQGLINRRKAEYAMANVFK